MARHWPNGYFPIDLLFGPVVQVAHEKAVYLLYAFMKKSTIRIAPPKADAALIETRLKRARVLDAED